MLRFDDASPLPMEYSFAGGFECQPIASPREDRLDDRTRDYVLRSRPHFNGLNKAIAQIAGLLVLAAAGGRSAPDHPMMAVADELYTVAAQSLAGLRPPPECLHHHRHLSRAGTFVGTALKAARLYLWRRDAAALDEAAGPLKSAYREMHAASCCLPGFEIVDFSDSCCAGPRLCPV